MTGTRHASLRVTVAADVGARVLVRRAAILGLCVLVAAGCTDEESAPVAGDCFVDPPRQIETTPVVDCAEGTFELVAVADLDEEGTYPGLETLSALAFDRCSAAVEEYTGQELLASDYDIWFHHPDETAWSSGDRRFVCAVTRVDGQPLGGSTAG